VAASEGFVACQARWAFYLLGQTIGQGLSPPSRKMRLG